MAQWWFDPEQAASTAAIVLAGYGTLYGVLVAVLPPGAKRSSAPWLHAGLGVLGFALLALGAYSRFTEKPAAVAIGYAVPGAIAVLAMLLTWPLIRQLGGGACARP